MPEITPSQLHRYLQAHAVGRSNAIAASVLQEALALGASALRELVHELREGDVLIGSSMSSSAGGYYIPATYEEAVEGVQHLQSRIRHLSRAYAGQVRAIKRNHPSAPPKQLSPQRPPLQHALFDEPSRGTGGSPVSAVGPRSAPTITP